MANLSTPPPPPPPPSPPTTPIHTSLLQSVAPSSSPSSLDFSLKISEKLDEQNFHLWRQQIETYINAHDLTHFVVCPEILVQFLTEEDRRSGKVNPAFSSWRLRDQMLLSWLQSTLTKEILALFLCANHAYKFGTSCSLIFRSKHEQRRVIFALSFVRVLLNLLQSKNFSFAYSLLLIPWLPLEIQFQIH